MASRGEGFGLQVLEVYPQESRSSAREYLSSRSSLQIVWSSSREATHPILLKSCRSSLEGQNRVNTSHCRTEASSAVHLGRVTIEMLEAFREEAVGEGRT
jgi:hypothetical protein